MVHHRICFRHLLSKYVDCISYAENWSSNLWFWKWYLTFLSTVILVINFLFFIIIKKMKMDHHCQHLLMKSLDHLFDDCLNLNFGLFFYHFFKCLNQFWPLIIFFIYRHSSTKATLIALICTFFEFCNIPVFWPILLLYFITLFLITMKRQIRVCYYLYNYLIA